MLFEVSLKSPNFGDLHLPVRGLYLLAARPCERYSVKFYSTIGKPLSTGGFSLFPRPAPSSPPFGCIIATTIARCPPLETV